MRYAVCVASLCAVVLSVPSFGLDIPKLINYQGMLTDDVGSPLTDTVSMTFQIWTDSVSGVWNRQKMGGDPFRGPSCQRFVQRDAWKGEFS